MTDRKETLTSSIRAQEEKIKQLKTNNAESTDVDAEIAVLKGLKQELDALTGGKKKGKAAKNAFTLKTAKVILYKINLHIINDLFIMLSIIHVKKKENKEKIFMFINDLFYITINDVRLNRVPKIIMTRKWLFVKKCFRQLPRCSRNTVLLLLIHLFLNLRLVFDVYLYI